MARYKLLAGTFTDFDRTKKPNKETGRHPNKTHHAGAIIDSDEDLVEKFGTSKFLLVGEGPRKHISKTPGDTAPGLNPTAFPAGQVEDGFQQTTGGSTEEDEQVQEGGFSDPDSGSRSGPASDEVRQKLEAQESKANQQKMAAKAEQDLKDKEAKLKANKQAHQQAQKEAAKEGKESKAKATDAKEDEDFTTAQLKGMTKAELQSTCDDLEITYDDKATKEELIQLIQK